MIAFFIGTAFMPTPASAASATQSVTTEMTPTMEKDKMICMMKDMMQSPEMKPMMMSMMKDMMQSPEMKDMMMTMMKDMMSKHDVDNGQQSVDHTNHTDTLKESVDHTNHQ
jgi:hypothetical protein